jgi:hypothetical protein
MAHEFVWEAAMRRMVWVAMLALAGCSDWGGGTHGSGRGLPEVTMTAQEDWIVPPGRGRTALAVRAFVPGANGEWQEVAGARCQVTGSPFFAADLMTPARLVLPDLGPDAPSLMADCISGAARGQGAVAPDYGWQESGGTHGQRMVFGAGWWRGYDGSGPLSYPDLSVGMR